MGLIALLELCVVVYVLYRSVLGLWGLRTPTPIMAGAKETRFLVLILARNEERVIGGTVERLRQLDYPAEHVIIVTVADDCSDRTAEMAESAGSIVLVKPGPATGKGAAIAWALDQALVADAAWDALVLLDADSRPRVDFLAQVDAAISNGATVAQARSESLPSDDWLSRGYALNNRLRNRLWHLARDRAGFGAILTGTGVVFARSLLREHPLQSRTVTEDLEYTAALAAAGIRGRYLYDALIDIEQPGNLNASVRQRVRWARGQIMTALLATPALVRQALLHRDFSALDTALYIAMPTIVPLQALLAGWLALSSAVDTSVLRGLPGGGELSMVPAVFVLVLSFVVQIVAMYVDRARLRPADWLGYAGLMLTWLPLAMYAALTAGVRTWRPTPHGAVPPDTRDQQA